MNQPDHQIPYSGKIVQFVASESLPSYLGLNGYGIENDQFRFVMFGPESVNPKSGKKGDHAPAHVHVIHKSSNAQYRFQLFESKHGGYVQPFTFNSKNEMVVHAANGQHQPDPKLEMARQELNKEAPAFIQLWRELYLEHSNDLSGHVKRVKLSKRDKLHEAASLAEEMAQWPEEHFHGRKSLHHKEKHTYLPKPETQEPNLSFGQMKAIVSVGVLANPGINNGGISFFTRERILPAVISRIVSASLKKEGPAANDNGNGHHPHVERSNRRDPVVRGLYQYSLTSGQAEALRDKFNIPMLEEGQPVSLRTIEPFRNRPTNTKAAHK